MRARLFIGGTSRFETCRKQRLAHPMERALGHRRRFVICPNSYVAMLSKLSNFCLSWRALILLSWKPRGRVMENTTDSGQPVTRAAF